MDLERVTVVLARPDDLDQVVVRVGSPSDASAASDTSVHRLGDVLLAANVGRLESPARARVRPDAVRFHAAGLVDEEWDARFAGLLERSSSHPPEEGIPAVVVWPSSEATAKDVVT